jgi:hypothetical protein
LLEKQEDILYEEHDKEHDKCINTEKSLALEIKKNEILFLNCLLTMILLLALKV